LESALHQELDAKAVNLAPQKGRENHKEDRRFQEEKRKIVELITTPAQYRTVPGRPVSRFVLVGCGPTRMPAIGRLLTQQVTSVVPEKTVNRDEAVALGWAVNQLGASDNAVASYASGHPQGHGGSGWER
jgi:Hsp70 protein